MGEPDHIHRWSILGEALSHAMFGSLTVGFSPVSMRRGAATLIRDDEESSRYIDEGMVRTCCGWRVASWRTYLEPWLMVEWVSTVDESVAGRLSLVALPHVVSNDQVCVYSDASISQAGGIGPGPSLGLSHTSPCFIAVHLETVGLSTFTWMTLSWCLERRVLLAFVP